MMIPSKQYREYEKQCKPYIPKGEPITAKVNIKCVYFMPTRRKVDLLNLLSATMDILVHYGVIEDDNSDIVVGHDGSRCEYDKQNPRVEIEIREMKENADD